MSTLELLPLPRKSLQDEHTSSSARARTERSLRPAGLLAPLSEFLLPAKPDTEPRLAVTGLVIVCITVRVDGMPFLGK